MKAADLDGARRLVRDLEGARRLVNVFDTFDGEMVPAYAQLPGYGEEVELLPVPKEVAVSAAKRRVDKLVSELAQLGVEA